MAILHLEEAKELKKHGKRLGRAGLSQYIIKAVGEFDGSYKGAIELAGMLHAATIAARADDYWTEKSQRGYRKALHELTVFKAEPVMN
jgi:hypothetical protein